MVEGVSPPLNLPPERPLRHGADAPRHPRGKPEGRLSPAETGEEKGHRNARAFHSGQMSGRSFETVFG
jgi:hypothetical protein